MNRSGRIWRRCRSCAKTTPGKTRCPNHPGADRVWAFEVDVAPEGAPRRRVAKTGFPTQAAAREAMTEILSTVVTDGGYEPPSKLTLGEWVDEWLELKRHDVKPSTLKTYRETLHHHVVGTDLGSTQLRRLTPAAVRRHLNGIADRGRSRITVSNVHRLVTMALEEAVRQNLIRTNPAKGQWRKPTEGSKEIRVPDAAELRHLFDTVAGHEAEHLVRVAAGSGLRRGELLGLRWSDVDTDAHTIRVSRALTIDNGEVAFTTPKSKRANRTVVVDSGTIQALRAQHRRNLETAMRHGRRNDHDLLFLKTNGEIMSPDWASRTVTALLKRAGLAPATLHQLRRSYVTLALQAGIPAQIVSQQVGHHAASFTLTQYASVFADAAQEQADVLGSLLDGTG